ncbi:hypothetical protein T492DRAFT_1078358 [Pavlovales sp. CCMP2436]|nr:hypothetical protein T492DRAFT_1078358 [Pavlovales sp. CCMP2436]
MEAPLAPELSALWAQAVAQAAGAAGLAGADAEALAASADVLWAGASSRLELVTREGAVAELDEKLEALTTKLAAQRTEVPAAVREQLSAKHAAHIATLEASVQRVRELEAAPLAQSPACDPSCVKEIEQLAARHASVTCELEVAAAEVREQATREAQFAEQLDRAIEVEARPCATQDMISAPGLKHQPAGERAAQGRALAMMEQQLVA